MTKEGKYPLDTGNDKWYPGVNIRVPKIPFPKIVGMSLTTIAAWIVNDKRILMCADMLHDYEEYTELKWKLQQIPNTSLIWAGAGAGSIIPSFEQWVNSEPRINDWQSFAEDAQIELNHINRKREYFLKERGKEADRNDLLAILLVGFINRIPGIGILTNDGRNMPVIHTPGDYDSIGSGATYFRLAWNAIFEYARLTGFPLGRDEVLFKYLVHFSISADLHSGFPVETWEITPEEARRIC